MAIEKSILYFSEPGETNTDKLLEFTKKRACELGITDIVIASVRGCTGLKAVEIFKDFNVVVVTHSMGFREPGKLELDEVTANKIKSKGGKILTTSHAFANINRAIRNKFDTISLTDIVPQTLRLFSQGMNVLIECATMAADAGLIPVDKDIISIAGSKVGADTAVILRPANSNRFFDLKILEIIAKPRNF